MIGAVLDTNVLSSGIAGEALPASSPGELFRRWLVNRFELVLSEHILAELQRTLAKPYYRARLTSPQVDRVLASLRTHARIVPVTVQVTGVATHPEDDLVPATAVSVGADYLVTGDRAFQALGRYHGVTILSPRAFLTLLDQHHPNTP